MNTIPLVTGTDVFQGAFVGVTPGGTHAMIYENCAYNKTLTSLDRIGNIREELMVLRDIQLMSL